MRHITVLGSTGSIGTNTLEVLDRNREEYRLVSIAAGENIEVLKEQIQRFSPSIAAVKNKNDAEMLQRIFPGTKMVYGRQGLLELVNDPRIDTMVSAINGTVALEATLVSLKNNHRICLANKETLVAAGELINNTLAGTKAEIIPIDSEQSAIFQSLGDNHREFIKRVILTASGGPFFKKDRDEFSKITIKQALAHPTWDMGAKITIDSATLMNKALEIIEAFYLFRLNKEQIDVIIHPQSIIHSMVEFIDSSIIAQLSNPDMKLPILYSFSYPGRKDFPKQNLDFARLRKLEFHPVDKEKFTSIKMAYHALTRGKNSGAVLNAANEVAVEYFLREQISFHHIFDIVEEVFYNEKFYPISSLEDVMETIKHTKQKTHEYIKKHHRLEI